LALKEVAQQLERKIEIELPKNIQLRQERFLACISSNHEIAKKVIRKTARLASYYGSKWQLLYVQTPKESGDNIGLAAQRHLLNNLKLGTELGAEIIRLKSENIAKGIFEVTEQYQITTICIGKPHLNLLNIILNTAVFNQLLQKLSKSEIDIVILS
jgi:two-component system sensor histidine kinase KdpD